VKKGRLKALLKVVLTLAIIVGGYLAYRSIRNYYYEKQLAEILARLDATEPGWLWEDRFNKLPKLSKEENAGEEIKSIMRLLTLDEYRAMLGKNQLSPLAEANRVYMKDHPNALLPALNREEMAKLLASSPCPEALRRARNLTQYSMGLLPHQFRPILSMSGLPDVQSTRELIRLFCWNVALEAEAHHSEQAANDISTMLHIVRIYDHDPFTICMLVRSALVQMSCHATHRLLAQTTQISPATHKRLQDEFLREETLMISLPEIYRWERAIYDHDLKLLHSGKLNLAGFLEQMGNMYTNGPTITKWVWLDNILKKVYPPIVLGFWAEPHHFAQERADQLNFYNRVIAWAGSPEHQLLENFKTMQQQGPGVSPFVYKLPHSYGNGTLENYQKESYKGIDRIARAMLTYRAHCRCIAAALAAERYRLDQGTWPTTWEQLSPKYLPTTLLDPFTGKPLFLKTLPDGLMIYSVGYNGIDDGGKIFPTEKQFQNDIGYRLWNPEQRRVDMSKELKAIEEELKGDD
jgi:hypothetical protein